MVKQPQERIILFSEQPNHKILHDNSSQQLPSRRGSLSGSRGRHGIDGQKRAKYAVPSRRGECCSLTAPLTAVIAAKQTAFVISGTVPARSSAARLHPALQPDGFRGDRCDRLGASAFARRFAPLFRGRTERPANATAFTFIASTHMPLSRCLLTGRNAQAAVHAANVRNGKTMGAERRHRWTMT